MALPFQRHQKLRQLAQKQLQSNSSNRLEVLRDRPFWIWDRNEHLKTAVATNQQCCFNHICGLPIKNNKEYPLFDYQKLLYDNLMLNQGTFKDKHLYVLKATGLGVSEFFLRLMAWLAVKDDTYRNSQMVVVTGPNWDLAIKLMKRLRNIFEPKLGIYFQDKETVLNLNGCIIESFPSNHLDSFRSLTNPSFLLLDELDFIRKSEQDDVRNVSERYIGKSDPYIVMISTPNAPNGLFENIQKEPEQTCIYKRLFLDYNYGLGKIFTTAEIDKARMSPSFDREYCLKFLGHIGNVFSPLQIDRAIELGQKYKDLPINNFVLHTLGVDPAFSSSNSAIVLCEMLKEENKIRVLESREFENHPSPQFVCERIYDIYKKYQNTWIFIDGANRGFITQLKIMFGEEVDYDPKEEMNTQDNRVIPVSFMKEHRNMLSNLYNMISKDYICIPEKFDRLIVSLRTATATEYDIDKSQTSYNDSLDALMLAMRGYSLESSHGLGY